MISRVSENHKLLIHHASALLSIGLRIAMRNQPGWTLLEEPQECLEQLIEERFREPAQDEEFADVVVTDYHSAMQYWVERRDLLRASRGRNLLRIVMVTNVQREHLVREALAGGVEGYLSDLVSIAELCSAVREVAHGRRHVSGCIAHLLAQGIAQPGLTSREVEVLRLITIGRPNKCIARELDIASGTVKSHVRSILSKLEVGSRTEAAHVAQARGLVPSEEDAQAPASSLLPVPAYRPLQMTEFVAG